MPVESRLLITRKDCINERDKIFVFGDNLMRKGYGGQAEAMRGEPNAVGIAVKKAPRRADEDYFTDDAYLYNVTIIDQDMRPLFTAVAAGKTVVLPAAGIGTERADLANRAPRTFAYLQEQIFRLIEMGKFHTCRICGGPVK